MAGEKRGKKTKKAKETAVPRRPPENLAIRDRSPSPCLLPRGAPLPHDPLMNGIAYSLPPPYNFGRPYMDPRQGFTEVPPQSPSMMSTLGYATPQGFTRYTSGSQRASSSGSPMATPSPTASHHSSSSTEQYEITGPDLRASSSVPDTPAANDLPGGVSAPQLESYDSSSSLWLPDKASSLLTEDIQKLFKDSPTWGQMSPNRQRQIYFTFKDKCVWRPEHETQMAQNFKKKAQCLLCDMLGRVRQSNKKPGWILPENYNKLLHYWATNERFLQLSDIGKKARNSTKGGSLHTSGAMSQEAVRRKLELKRGTPVPQDEAFKITHVKKKANANDPDDWCDERAKQTYGKVDFNENECKHRIDESNYAKKKIPFSDQEHAGYGGENSGSS
ncbi:uncharacterized protein LOC132619604 [Lycium barbarum]|uniref:uncharacterized protein LOC132619604 n=1 Tax=Lycium barbarum TaxID=112863 RepID=UPI00293EBCCB|nr:uncharacterized protein LOC132619604 [Lycium barbarum]